jgi:hypothetical protein
MRSVWVVVVVIVIVDRVIIARRERSVDCDILLVL